jgi:hypothetical protein
MLVLLWSSSATCCEHISANFTIERPADPCSVAGCASNVRGASLHREVHAAEQCLKPRVRAQPIQSRIGLQVEHAFRTALISLVQPLERPVFLPQAGVNDRNIVRRNISLLNWQPQLRPSNIAVIAQLLSSLWSVQARFTPSWHPDVAALFFRPFRAPSLLARYRGLAGSPPAILSRPFGARRILHIVDPAATLGEFERRRRGRE